MLGIFRREMVDLFSVICECILFFSNINNGVFIRKRDLLKFFYKICDVFAIFATLAERFFFE